MYAHTSSNYAYIAYNPKCCTQPPGSKTYLAAVDTRVKVLLKSAGCICVCIRRCGWTVRPMRDAARDSGNGVGVRVSVIMAVYH